jgi:aspartate/glutamate racemase
MIKSTSAAKPTQYPTPQASAKAGATATTTSVTATGATPPPTKARFDNAADTLRFLEQDYIPGLTRHAQAFEATHGRKPKDQDFPTESIRMVPPHPKLPSLLIVGGMGPLAGAQAMQAALTQFGDSREIVLLQLCNVPDRTGALNENARQQGRSDAHLQVVDAMKQGFMGGEGALECAWVDTSPAVVACNTAHNFAPEAFAAYQQERAHNAGLQMNSLVQCVVSELSRTQHGQEAPVVILGTDGTLKTRLYINPLEANGVHCAVPTPEGQQLLMDAIYKGVKAFSEDETVKSGNALFLDMKATGQIVEGKPFVNLTGNATEVYAIEHERIFPGGTAWLSLAALGLPAALFLQSFLFPPRHGTTALDAFVDRIRFDAT